VRGIKSQNLHQNLRPPKAGPGYPAANPVTMASGKGSGGFKNFIWTWPTFRDGYGSGGRVIRAVR